LDEKNSDEVSSEASENETGDSDSDQDDGNEEEDSAFEEDATFGRMNQNERARQAEDRVLFGTGEGDEMALDEEQEYARREFGGGHFCLFWIWV
jgi:hypothetical protein